MTIKTQSHRLIDRVLPDLDNVLIYSIYNLYRPDHQVFH